MQHTFSSRDRLCSKADFARLRGGLKLASGGVRLIYIANTLQHARFGLAVSRKYGNAVQRNKLKRQWRECFRRSEIRSMHVDVLAIPVRSHMQMKHPIDDIQRAFDRLLDKKGQ
ncbi:MAG: ribonuclease P protein component [Mariprofundaceae bacterium]